MTVEVAPIRLDGEVQPGDDLPTLLGDAISRTGLVA